jgi:hypothetical protein
MKILMGLSDNSISLFLLSVEISEISSLRSESGKKQSSLLFSPKKALHGKIKKSDIIKLEKKLNNRPRKRLNYLTPYEVFVKKMNPKNFQA